MFWVTCWKQFYNTVQGFLKHVGSLNFLNFNVNESIIAIELTFSILAFFSQRLKVIKLSSRRRAILNKVMFPISLIILSHYKFPILWSVKTVQKCKSLSQIIINKIMYTFLTFHYDVCLMKSVCISGLQNLVNSKFSKWNEEENR